MIYKKKFRISDQVFYTIVGINIIQGNKEFDGLNPTLL